LVLSILELASRLGLLVAARLLFLQNWDRRLLLLVVISGVDSHFALLFSSLGVEPRRIFVSGCGDGCFVEELGWRMHALMFVEWMNADVRIGFGGCEWDETSFAVVLGGRYAGVIVSSDYGFGTFVFLLLRFCD
jgi:hypothetical protein